MGDQCCGTEEKGKGGGCCGTKKLIVTIAVGVLVFLAGMWFAKANCDMSGKTCPMSGMQK